MTVSAISAMTSAWRVRPWSEPALPPRPPSRSTFTSCDQGSRRAGHVPAARPAPTPHAKAKNTRAASTRTSWSRGTASVALAPPICSNVQASPRPAAPPTAPRSADSARSCRASRPRPAPSDARTASSRARTVPRARNRFMTFTMAISRTSVIVPKSRRRVRRTSPTSVSLSVRRPYRHVGLTAYLSRSTGVTAAVSFEAAASAVTPGASRLIVFR